LDSFGTLLSTYSTFCSLWLAFYCYLRKLYLHVSFKFWPLCICYRLYGETSGAAVSINCSSHCNRIIVLYFGSSCEGSYNFFFPFLLSIEIHYLIYMLLLTPSNVYIPILINENFCLTVFCLSQTLSFSFIILITHCFHRSLPTDYIILEWFGCRILFADPVAVRHALTIICDLAKKDPYSIAMALG